MPASAKTPDHRHDCVENGEFPPLFRAWHASCKYAGNAAHRRIEF